MESRWLDGSELRIGLGCMRLPADEEAASSTIAAAAAAGVRIFDTAHAYGARPEAAGHNERLLARALRNCGAAPRARIVTKGGMTRVGDRWIADGRSRMILADCEAGLRALDGLPVDLFLVHAPDPRTPWPTTVRALARILDEGLARHVGVANVNRRQLEEALTLTDITAVQVALNPFDDHALRGGLVDLCEQRGIAVIAHSPLGGPRRVARLARIPALAEVAKVHSATPAEVALAWLLDLSPNVIAIPGARRPETARSAARAARLSLSEADRELLRSAIGGRAPAGPATPRPTRRAEVVLVMGIPGAGKSRVAESFVARGYTRLNRDDRGGSLRELASVLDERLADGVESIVLDNTYLTRASRNQVIETGRRHHASVRCLWLDISLEQAQVNMVERLLDRFGALPSPDELQRVSRREPGLHTPTSQMRTLRELEPPSIDEGFDDVERRPFQREGWPDRTQLGVLVAAEALSRPGWKGAIAQIDPRAPHLIFDWCPEGCADRMERAAAELTQAVAGGVETAVCPHAGGAPVCWCRPPLPGLPLAFARAHEIDLSRSAVVGTSAAHRRLAALLGARFLPV